MSSASIELSNSESPNAAASPSLSTLLLELDRSEHLDPDELRRIQFVQLRALSAYFAQYSLLYQKRLRDAGITALDSTNFSKLLPLTRRHLQSAEAEFFVEPPPAHLPVSETRTSGSSGEPVVIHRTALTQLFWLAYSMREHLWWSRDFSGTLVVMRANLGQEKIALDSWGPPAALLTTTGPAYAFSLTLDIAAQAAMLSNINPHYLMTYPNNLAALLRYVERHNLRLPNLKQIRSLGETLSQELRAECRRVLNVSIADTYSSQEVGVIAIECAHSGLYHVMAENLIVEVVDANGRVCVEGEMGQVLITDLHNFASPVIRYAIGDMAEVGPLCCCGRTLPTLRRILGRTRNIVHYPDGTTRYPLVGFYKFRKIAPIAQYQAVQTRLDHIEMRLVVERSLSNVEENKITAIVQAAIGYPFTISYRYFEKEIPRRGGGKFEEFISLLAD